MSGPDVAKAMRSIDGARFHHDATCRYGGTAIEVHMNPADADRLGFDDGEDVCGLRLCHDPKLGLGRIRVYCDVELEGLEPSTTSAIASTTTRREVPLPA